MNNIAVVLSGGSGTRMGTDLPKQYMDLLGKPVLVHTLGALQRCQEVEGVVAVVHPAWEKRIFQWKEQFQLNKLLVAAPAGENRQLSIRNGLLAAQPFMTQNAGAGVIIQDAARPLTSVELLSRLVQELQDAPAVLPALPITDTTYVSRDGQWVDGLLERSTLFAGQAPEAFHYWPYMTLYRDTPAEELGTMSGSCQLPYRAGWKVKLIQGGADNLKITYMGDWRMCEKLLTERGDTT